MEGKKIFLTVNEAVTSLKSKGKETTLLQKINKS